MTDSPDAIRADIENTRRELGGDVDALADKVTPSKIVQRQTDKVKSAVGSVRERIMGAADDAGSSVSHAGSAAMDGLSDAKDRVVAKAEGNPLAVGLIAFGVGLVVASLIPASNREKDMAAGLKEQAQPLMDEVAGAAKEMGEHLKQPAQDAAAAVKDTASEAFANVKGDAEDATHAVADRGQAARENLADA